MKKKLKCIDLHIIHLNTQEGNFRYKEKGQKDITLLLKKQKSHLYRHE